MLKVIWIILKIWFKRKILYPIKARWNYIRYGTYISDNMRNRALLEFCEKVMADAAYEPEGVYESLFEERLKEVYNAVIDYSKKTFPEEAEAWMNLLMKLNVHIVRLLFTKIYFNFYGLKIENL